MDESFAKKKYSNEDIDKLNNFFSENFSLRLCCPLLMLIIKSKTDLE